MSDDEKHGINIDKIITNRKYVVTWKGKDAQKEWFDVESKKSGKYMTLALEHLMNRDGKKCRRCGREEFLTVDHIIPVMLLEMMGMKREDTYYDFENLQILCRMCNAFKGARIDFTDPRAKPLLIKYVSAI